MSRGTFPKGPIGLLCLSLLISSCGRPEKLGSNSIQHSQSVFSAIVGGTKTTDGEMMNVVGLVDLQESKIFCSGVLVHSGLVLTAAHCLVDKLPENIGVYFGSGSAGGKVLSSYPVQKLGIHPMFNEFRLSNLNQFNLSNVLNNFTASWMDIGYVTILGKAPYEPGPLFYGHSRLDELWEEGKQWKALMSGFGFRQSTVGSDDEVDPYQYGEKYQAESQILGLAQTDVEIGKEGVGIAKGDSGGPVFVRTKRGLELLAINSRMSLFVRQRTRLPIERFSMVWPALCWVEEDSGIDLTSQGPCHGMSEKELEDFKSLISNPAIYLSGAELFKLTAQYIMLHSDDRQLALGLLERLDGLLQGDHGEWDRALILAALSSKDSPIKEELTQKLRELIKENNPLTTLDVISMFAHLELTTTPDLELVAQALNSPFHPHRVMSLVFLSEFGIPEKILPRIMDLASSCPNLEMKSLAQYVLTQVASSNESVLRLLLTILKSYYSTQVEKVGIINGLAKYGVENSSVISALIDMAQFHDHGLIELAGNYLNQMPNREQEIFEQTFKRYLETKNSYYTLIYMYFKRPVVKNFFQTMARRTVDPNRRYYASKLIEMFEAIERREAEEARKQQLDQPGNPLFQGPPPPPR